MILELWLYFYLKKSLQNWLCTYDPQNISDSNPQNISDSNYDQKKL